MTPVDQMKKEHRAHKCRFCAGKGYVFVRDAATRIWGSIQCRKCHGTGEKPVKREGMSRAQNMVRWNILNGLGR